MENRSELKPCPKCGAAISSEAPQGLCPKCLLAEVSLPTEAGRGAFSKGTAPTIEELAAAFPQLEILEKIGQGGMGFVFKARQPKLDRFVALKILPESLAADAAFAERFTREGRVLARLNHPNIVTIHDIGQVNGLFYLLMEYVDGVNLREAMKVGRFTPEQALAVVPRICDALQFAHNEGILHRDIKPENILLDSKGRVKIADFGIAKILGAETGGAPGVRAEEAGEHNATGVIGTPQYMAPEQIEDSRRVDQRADIYSLGVVFYEMLTGELPLGRFAPPSEKSAIDPRLDEVVLRALEKEPMRRTASAGELKTQVETIVTRSGGGSMPVKEEVKETETSSAGGPTGLPWAVRVIAIIFMVSGASSIWEVVSGLSRNIYSFNLGMLALPIGIGLLRRRPWWRVTALASLWFCFALLIVSAGILFGWVGVEAIHSKATIFGQEVIGLYRIWISLLVIGVIAAVLIWIYRVLVRPDVKACYQGRGFQRPWIEWGALLSVFLLALAVVPRMDHMRPSFTNWTRTIGAGAEGKTSSGRVLLHLKQPRTGRTHVSIVTDTPLTPRQKVRALLRFPDSRTEEALTSSYNIATGGWAGEPISITTSTTFSWPLPPDLQVMAQNQMMNGVADGTARLEEEAPFTMFTVTNSSGGVFTGLLRYNIETPLDGSNAAQQRTSVTITSATNVMQMLLAYYTCSVPPAHRLSVYSRASDHSPTSTHYGSSQAQNYQGSSSRWDFPRTFSQETLEAAARQVSERANQGPILLSPGGEVEIFSVTNASNGKSFRGFFKVTGPDEIR